MSASSKLIEDFDNTSDSGQHLGNEFILSDEVFANITRRISNLTGILVPSHKRQMIYTRLSRRLRATGKNSFDDYLEYLDSRQGVGELENFTNAITTNTTNFFRENHHFEHLSSIVKTSTEHPSMLSIWSAGCSTGQEPYTIAMTLHSALEQYGSKYKILATDIDTNVLEAAKLGRYDVRYLPEIPVELAQYMPVSEGKFEIGISLKKNIHFKRLNLFEKLPFEGSFDFIFCRNVLIYFDIEQKISIINKLVSRLKPGGFLYLGHSETLFSEVPSLKSCGNTIYEKTL